MRAVLAALCLLFATPAMAMELGTYRPGQAYHSNMTPTASECATLCQADSQCRGWNFVKSQAAMNRGVCEFNSRRVAPVASPISISGESLSEQRLTARIVSAGTRTIRVGSPTASPFARRLPRPSLETQPQIVMSKPVERSNYMGHMLDDAPVSHPAPKSNILRHNLDDTTTGRYDTSVPAQVTPPTYMQYRSQSQTKNISRQPEQASAPLSEPVIAPHEMPKVAISVPRGSSLFGSLHDDVSVPNLDPNSVPQDQDAPIPTVVSVPSAKVMKEQLDGLAGANR